MIVINRIPVQTCKVYCCDDKFIGEVDHNNFNDVRVQIKEQKLNGYYVIFDLPNGEHRFDIDSDGRSRDWTEETFGQFEKIARKLL